MSSSDFIPVPRSAFKARAAARGEDKLTDGEWILYVTLCSFRNRETGRCDPSLQALIQATGRGYHHVSRLRSALVSKGWIALDGDAVTFIVGAEEFPRSKVESLRNFANGCANSQTPQPQGPAKFANFNNEFCEISQTHIKAEQDKQLDIAAMRAYVRARAGDGAAAAVAGFEIELKQVLQGPVPEAFLAEVIASNQYQSAYVQNTWVKLQEHCRKTGIPPTKYQLFWWLENERPKAQPNLPGVGATLHEMPRTSAQPAKKCDHTCPLCFGSGREVVPGKGARRCSNMVSRAGGEESQPAAAEARRDVVNE